jgi:hypothetical protein
MKPVFGVWMFKIRSSSSRAFRKPWRVPTGTEIHVPAERAHDFVSDRELGLAFEDVERVDMIVVPM